jgi:hypothetical protein
VSPAQPAEICVSGGGKARFRLPVFHSDFPFTNRTARRIVGSGITRLAGPVKAADWTGDLLEAGQTEERTQDAYVTAERTQDAYVTDAQDAYVTIVL